MQPLAITARGLACATGIGCDALAAALASGASALAPNDFAQAPLPGWVGRVAALDTPCLPAALAPWDCRATRLAWLGLQADGFAAGVQRALTRLGTGRVGLVLGTSASTIGVSEAAYRQLDAAGRFPPQWSDARLNTPHAIAMFASQALGLEGPALTVSTACSSSAKAFAVAARWLALGLADAVVVGGVDALCASTLYGFAALGLVSAEPCRPFDRARSGISVGEAAGFVLLERGDAGSTVQLCGYGEANDAYHMSAPHPQGLGAERALDAALARAGLPAEALDYVNLHGTATAQNDEVEAALAAHRYAAHTALSATKGLTGHTMGAAGIVEALVCLVALEGGIVPGTANTRQPEPALGNRLVLQPRRAALRSAASHSFGFGGSNCVLILARAQAGT
jgi:3-oxoacyl-[acyl-carrier-protein] synthase-1